VLPPSFPYGGMENACLTFASPTLLTGDRSLVDIIVHELTHSWFGNGVTLANADHLWLNEGFTTYMERVLIAKIHSPAARDFAYVIGARSLRDSLSAYQARPRYQRLVVEFERGEDPDGAYSQVPYEKGANFLLHLERTLGGTDVFLPYVYDYVSTFTGKSITTEQWKEHLYDYFRKHNQEKVKALDTVDFQAWLYGEGVTLPVDMKYDTTLAQRAYDLAARWDKSRNESDPSNQFGPSDVESFDANHKVVFLQALQSYPALPSSHIDLLAKLYHLSTSANAEIRNCFYAVALQDPTSTAAKAYVTDALKWVVGEDGSGVVQGRIKFCRAVFRRTDKVDHESTVKVFRAHQRLFHPIAHRFMKGLGLA